MSAASILLTGRGLAGRGFSGRAAGFARLFVLAAAVSCTPAGPPDLVLVTLDTTRADRLGPYGFEGARTPRLDALAREAMVYEHAYSTSSWTLPSHASLMTGLLPMQHGAQASTTHQAGSLGYPVRGLGAHFETLAERVHAAGYTTAAVVAGPALAIEYGLDQGFDVYHDSLDGPGEKLTGRRGADVADLAIAAIEAAGDAPLFLFVNFFDPHAPYAPPDSGRAGAAAPDGRTLVKPFIQRLESGAPALPIGELPAPGRRTLDAMLAGYDAEIAYMDLHLGRVLDALAERGRKSLVVVTADHGESFGEHYLLSHGAHLYEDNVRVPLIVRRPDGANAGTRVATPVQNHRAFATALVAAGLEIPAELQVEPLSDAALPIVTEVLRSQNNIRLFGPFFDRDLWAIRDVGDKLITSSRGEAALYDVEADPGELHDRSRQAPDRVAVLREKLAAIQQARAPRFDAATRAAPDADTEEALRALGYIE
jgi:choline-sulfatase